VAQGDLDAGTVAAALRPDGASPLHVQVEDGLRHLIRSGQVPVGAGLPGELGLAATSG
jgi:DNA-binding GntR family transcriptional regulator